MKRDKRAARRLEKAIRAGDLAKVRELIAAGVDVSAAFDGGATPIQLAAREKRIAVVRALAAAGASLNELEALSLEERLTLYRASSLMIAIPIEEVGDQYERIAEILQAAGTATAGRLELDLIWAVQSEEIDEARSLLAAGADPDARRFDGATALMLAVRDGRRDFVRLLIDAGCQVDARQWIARGPRAIDAAATARDQTTYQMLIAAGGSRHRLADGA